MVVLLQRCGVKFGCANWVSQIRLQSVAAIQGQTEHSKTRKRKHMAAIDEQVQNSGTETGWRRQAHSASKLCVSAS